MDKNAFIKLCNFLLKLYLPTTRAYLPAFLPIFFASGVTVQFVELRESKESKFTDIPYI